MRKAASLVFLVLFGLAGLHAEDRPEFLVSRALEAPKIIGELSASVAADVSPRLTPTMGENNAANSRRQLQFSDRH